MKKLIKRIVNLPSTKAKQHGDVTLWRSPEKKQLNIHQTCFTAIASQLALLYKAKFPVKHIEFSVKWSLKADLISTSLCVETNANAFDGTEWETLIDELTKKFENWFSEANKIAKNNSASPVIIEIRDSSQTELPFQDTKLSDNLIFVESMPEKVILKQIIKIARENADSEYTIGNNTHILYAIPSEDYNHSESDDLVEDFYVTNVCRRNLTAKIQSVSQRNKLGSSPIEVGFLSEQRKSIYDILRFECTAKLRVSTYTEKTSSGKEKLQLNRIEEIIDIFPDNKESSDLPDLFEEQT